MASSGAGSLCGACKFLRRRCLLGCVFAPYFCSDHGSAIFAAIHKVFGASNVSVWRMQVPVHQRFPAMYHGVGNQLPPAPFSAADLNATNPCTWPQNSGGLGKLQALALRMTKTEPSF
nr:LOB domain-containing protein 16-like [Ipomoea batatas]